MQTLHLAAFEDIKCPTCRHGGIPYPPQKPTPSELDRLVVDSDLQVRDHGGSIADDEGEDTFCEPADLEDTVMEDNGDQEAILL